MSIVLRFPMRRTSAVFVSREPLGGWLVIFRDHGWAFGSRSEAFAEAHRLAATLALPVRGGGP